MHDEAWQFVLRCVEARDPGLRLPLDGDVLDLGGCDVNGSVRPLFPGARYLSVDIAPGEGVDVVADACRWRSDLRFDIALCTETLEHVDMWELLIDTAVAHLRQGGWLLLTAAARGREPHGMRGGAPTSDEHYANVEPEVLIDVIEDLDVLVFEYHRYPGDVYVLARKP